MDKDRLQRLEQIMSRAYRREHVSGYDASDLVRGLMELGLVDLVDPYDPAQVRFSTRALKVDKL